MCVCVWGGFLNLWYIASKYIEIKPDKLLILLLTLQQTSLLLNTRKFTRKWKTLFSRNGWWFCSSLYFILTMGFKEWWLIRICWTKKVILHNHFSDFSVQINYDDKFSFKENNVLVFQKNIFQSYVFRPPFHKLGINIKS